MKPNRTEFPLLYLVLFGLTFEKTTENKSEELSKSQSENKKLNNFFVAQRNFIAAEERWK